MGPTDTYGIEVAATLKTGVLEIQTPEISGTSTVWSSCIRQLQQPKGPSICTVLCLHGPRSRHIRNPFKAHVSTI